MHTRTRRLVRDGSLALVALAGLLWRGRTARRSLGSPWAAAVGVLGSLAAEWVMLARPELAGRFWGRRSVRLGSLVAVVAGGRLLRRRDGRVLAALCWGLVTYLGLVIAVLVGGENPLARLVNR